MSNVNDTDIAPKLLEKVMEQYKDGMDKNKILQGIPELIEKETITYQDTNKAAQEIGKILSAAYGEHITSDVLPDGRLYYNIADRVVGTTMAEAYGYIADIAEETQKNLNKNAGIGIKAIRPGLNKDRIDGIINRVSSETDFDDVSWILDAPVKVFCQNIVDNAIKDNAEFQAKAGLEPRIMRKSSGKCCEWCSRIAGIYSYPDVPEDVYRRHDNCNCTVEFDPGTGKKHQDVWSKKWKYEKNFDRIRERESLGNNIKYKLPNMPKEEYARAKELWKKNNELILPQREKEYVYEELDNNLTTEEKESCLVQRAIENYRYKAINMGHNQCKIIEKKAILESIGDISIDQILDETLDFDWRKYIE